MSTIVTLVFHSVEPNYINTFLLSKLWQISYKSHIWQILTICVFAHVYIMHLMQLFQSHARIIKCKIFTKDFARICVLLVPYVLITKNMFIANITSIQLVPWNTNFFLYWKEWQGLHNSITCSETCAPLRILIVLWNECYSNASIFQCMIFSTQNYKSCKSSHISMFFDNLTAFQVFIIFFNIFDYLLQKRLQDVLQG